MRIPPPPTLTFNLDLPKCNYLVPCGQAYDSGVAEQLGGGWPSRGQTGVWLKWRAVLHVARRDVFVSVMMLLDEQTIRTENVQYLSDSSILNHRR